MLRVLLLLVAILGISGDAAAQGFSCSVENAWRKVRQANPLHSQIIASCEDRNAGEHVIVLTEPAPHILRAKAEAIIHALFASSILSVETRRQSIGYEGWAADLVITVVARTPVELETLGNDLALLARLNFGSTYKAEFEDIASMPPAPLWQAPPALEIRADELHTWLLGPNAEKLVPLGGGTAATLKERAARSEAGVYQTSSPGLIVALLASGSRNDLNDRIEELRRFTVDTDAFLGAFRLGSNRVALIGRERTTSVSAMPPLRLETILLLASRREAQLAQSYERNRAFAGKLLTDAGGLFGWDWAPILLSDELNDTELGSLLNLTDNMLKGWSESGKVQYKGFPHAYPSSYPFTSVGAHKFLDTKQLTYNWNTAGAGYITRIADTEVFAIRNTGSLPVSYFPEGAQGEAGLKARLVKAEDDAYRYFSSLRNPHLARAVQYAALYQVFQAFDLRAKAPHDPAPAKAAIGGVERLLHAQTIAALDRLADTAAPSNNEALLTNQYIEQGIGVRLQVPPDDLQTRRRDIARTVQELDATVPAWRENFSSHVAKGYGAPPQLAGRVQTLTAGLPLVVAPERVRKAVLTATDRQPLGWIRTPAIVVSKGDISRSGDQIAWSVGGHNIGGRATRVVVDASVPKGTVKAGGSYHSGREIRIHPDDAVHGRDLVRQFDRKAGLYDELIPRGARAAEARLRDLQPPPPVRQLAQALELAGTNPRSFRGASASPRAQPIGELPMHASEPLNAEVKAAFEVREADTIVAKHKNGFLVQGTPETAPFYAPNHASLLSLLEGGQAQAAIGTSRAGIKSIRYIDFSKDDLSAISATLANRGKAVAGAGGKPPFNGNRPILASAEPPWLGSGPGGAGKGPPIKRAEPGFFDKATDNALAVIGRKRQQKIEVIEGDPKILETKADWAKAETYFHDPQAFQLVGAPVFKGHSYFFETRVPVPEAGRIRRLFIQVKFAFQERLAPGKLKEIGEAVRGIFRGRPEATLGDAASQVKSLFFENYKATDFWTQMQLEGARPTIGVEEQSLVDRRQRG